MNLAPLKLNIINNLSLSLSPIQKKIKQKINQEESIEK